MKLSTVMKWAAIAFVLWCVVTEPATAAKITENVGGFLSHAAHGTAAFLSSF